MHTQKKYQGSKMNECIKTGRTGGWKRDMVNGEKKGKETDWMEGRDIGRKKGWNEG